MAPPKEKDPSQSDESSSIIRSKTIKKVDYSKLGGDIVELYVGPKKQLFRVHKAFLCDHIHFEKMFMGGFKEARENIATFPEDSIESFEVLVEWVYTGRLRDLVFDSDKKIKL